MSCTDITIDFDFMKNLIKVIYNKISQIPDKDLSNSFMEKIFNRDFKSQSLTVNINYLQNFLLEADNENKCYNSIQLFRFCLNTNYLVEDKELIEFDSDLVKKSLSLTKKIV